MLFNEWVLSRISQPVSSREDVCSLLPVCGCCKAVEATDHVKTNKVVGLQNKFPPSTKEKPLHMYSWFDS